MEYRILVYVVIVVIVFALVLYLLKSFITAAIVAVIIILFFRIGFVYTSDEVVSALRMSKYMSPAKIEEFQDAYDNFSEKRSEDPVIIPEKLDKTIMEELQGKVKEYLDKKDTIETPVETKIGD